MARIVGVTLAAFFAGVLFCAWPLSSAVACDDRYLEQCRLAAPASATAEQPRAKRVHAHRVKRQAKVGSKSALKARFVNRSAKRKAHRTVRAKRSSYQLASVSEENDTRAKALEPKRSERSAGPPESAAQRRFRGFLSTNSLLYEEIEPWRRPRLVATLVFEPASPAASGLVGLRRDQPKIKLASISASRDIEATGSDDAAQTVNLPLNGDDVGAHAPNLRVATTFAAVPLDESPRAAAAAAATGSQSVDSKAMKLPAVSVSATVVNQEGADAFFSLRSLMLVLGGAVTIASALRLFVGV